MKCGVQYNVMRFDIVVIAGRQLFVMVAEIIPKLKTRQPGKSTEGGGGPIGGQSSGGASKKKKKRK